MFKCDHCGRISQSKVEKIRREGRYLVEYAACTYCGKLQPVGYAEVKAGEGASHGK